MLDDGGDEEYNACNDQETTAVRPDGDESCLRSHLLKIFAHRDPLLASVDSLPEKLIDKPCPPTSTQDRPSLTVSTIKGA